MYRLEYLPAARQDMIDIVGYISRELGNPAAAGDLAVKMVEAADKLVDFPYINPVYTPIKPLAREYRRLYVGSYIMFYHVDEAEKLITISRVIYARRDHERILRG